MCHSLDAKGHLTATPLLVRPVWYSVVHSRVIPSGCSHSKLIRQVYAHPLHLRTKNIENAFLSRAPHINRSQSDYKPSGKVNSFLRREEYLPNRCDPPEKVVFPVRVLTMKRWEGRVKQHAEHDVRLILTLTRNNVAADAMQIEQLKSFKWQMLWLRRESTSLCWQKKCETSKKKSVFHAWDTLTFS